MAGLVYGRSICRSTRHIKFWKFSPHWFFSWLCSISKIIFNFYVYCHNFHLTRQTLSRLFHTACFITIFMPTNSNTYHRSSVTPEFQQIEIKMKHNYAIWDSSIQIFSFCSQLLILPLSSDSTCVCLNCIFQSLQISFRCCNDTNPWTLSSVRRKCKLVTLFAVWFSFSFNFCPSRTFWLSENKGGSQGKGAPD